MQDVCRHLAGQARRVFCPPAAFPQIIVDLLVSKAGRSFFPDAVEPAQVGDRVQQTVLALGDVAEALSFFAQ